MDIRNGTEAITTKPTDFKRRAREYSEQLSVQFSSVQLLSSVWLFATPWIAARKASLSITNSRSLLRLTSIELVMPSSHLILCRPLLLLPPIPSSISLFQWVKSSHEVAKVLEFQLYHHSFQRTPRTDLLQNGLVGSPCSPRHSQESSPTPHSKASILRHSAFFTVQLSHPYMTTGKTIALTRRTFVFKVMSLIFNIVFRLVITFLPMEYYSAIKKNEIYDTLTCGI